MTVREALATLAQCASGYAASLDGTAERLEFSGDAPARAATYRQLAQSIAEQVDRARAVLEV